MPTTGLRDASPRNRHVAGHKRVGHARGLSAPVHSVALGPSYQYTAAGSITALYGSYAPLAYYLPWEVLDYVEILSTYNADYSQAVDNIRTLANSGHEIFVQSNSSRETKSITQYLNDLSRTVQERSGGIDGLIDKLLDQAATYGAMAGEWLVSEDGTEVVDFADVNPKSIRFFWNEENQTYDPYQRVSGAQATAAQMNGQQVINGCVQLNPLTFHYYAFDSAPQSPYGVPPFVAALEHIGIQRDMVANMSQIVKKIGLLGLVDLVVEQLPPKPGESDEAYSARATAYLDQYVEAAEDMVREGGLVHYNDVEVKTTNLGGNAAGATNIFKQNEEMIFSGLKSMPSVQGRSYSTTETYAGVAYDIIIRNTTRYQRACKRMIEAGYLLAANLKGFNPQQLQLNFHPNKTLHRLQDAQSQQLEIKNKAWLWLAGVLDQTGFAQELGYTNIVNPMAQPPEALVGSLRETITENGGTSDTTGTGDGKPDNANNNGGTGTSGK